MQNKYDVAVVGAGPAGVAAAAAAADGGARVVLIESSHHFGGSVTAAMHRCMCGLYSHAPQNPLDTLNGFSQRRIVERMLEKNAGSVRTRQFGKVWVLEFPAAAWESALADHSAKPSIDRCMGTRVVGVERVGNRIESIQVESDETRSIAVGALIDCTGGGNILRMIGADAFQSPSGPNNQMLGGFAMKLTGISGDGEMLRLQVPYLLAQAVGKGVLPAIARFTVFYPGPGVGEGICKLAIDLTKFSKEEAESLAREIFSELQRENSGLKEARIAEMSPAVLPRDGLRLRGEFTLGEEDVLGGKQYGVDAVHAWWPIERWDVKEGPSYWYPPVGQHYDIPADALRSAVIENLLAAGTCLSATAAAAASSRASGICLATGDAAGRLAGSIPGVTKGYKR